MKQRSSLISSVLDGFTHKFENTFFKVHTNYCLKNKLQGFNSIFAPISVHHHKDNYTKMYLMGSISLAEHITHSAVSS